MINKNPEELIIVNKETLYGNDAENEGVAVIDDKNEEAFLLHLASIVESSDDAIISKSLDGVIKSWNQGSEKMFGYTAAEAIGKNISLIIPKEYLEKEKEILDRISNNETIAHYETVRLRRSGEQFYVSITASPLKDKEGIIIGISKIARDITTQKNAQTNLSDVNKELAFQNEEKEKRASELSIANKELAFQNEEKEKRASELILANKELAFQNEEKEKRAVELIYAIKDLESFSYSVSHDLRTPLRAVYGFTKMLTEDYGAILDEEGHRLMNNIMKNAKKMGQLIDDLLAFSRIGRKEFMMTEISMDEIVKEVWNDLTDEQNNSPKPEFNIKDLPVVKGDKVTIKQVWINLISNAIKYSKHKDKPVIEIGAEIKDNETIYYIKDNGAGFDMRYANNLFGVFQRLHSESEFEGTGVGLAIVQKIINKHGGRVWAVAKVDEGATFFFTLK
jgi:PAS domain S-box-containing protein